jgi:hypothetical protein
MHVWIIPGVGLILAAFTEILRVFTGRSIFPFWGSALYIILATAAGIVALRKLPGLGEPDVFAKLNLTRSEPQTLPPSPKPDVGQFLRFAAAVTVLGMIGVVVAVLLGFEEAPRGLFLVSALCVFAAPAVLLSHLWLTKTMTGAEKRTWLRALTGRRAMHAASAYIAKQEGTRAES